MTDYCSACARPLKDQRAVEKGKVIVQKVCKSPICKKYMLVQR